MKVTKISQGLNGRQKIMGHSLQKRSNVNNLMYLKLFTFVNFIFNL